MPQFLLRAGFSGIAVTQPRRISAVSLSRRVAFETNTEDNSTIACVALHYVALRCIALRCVASALRLVRFHDAWFDVACRLVVHAATKFA